MGVGVTEAGLASSETPAMQHLFDILCALQQQQPNQTVVVIDMDNVPNNGSTIQHHMLQLAVSSCNGDSEATGLVSTYLRENVEFVNTMVDRITAAHPENPHIPRCEPLPRKALVIGDYQGSLANVWKMTTTTNSLLLPPGVLLRQTPEELQQDIALKLQIANGTHTAIAHALALSKHTQTTTLSSGSSDNGNRQVASLWTDYLDVLVQHQIITACPNNPDEAKFVWEDWRRRLLHPHFGLSTFFITQNGTSKGGIRWGPTVETLLEDATKTIQVSFAIAYATLLRWLTPTSSSSVHSGDVYRGWFLGVVDPTKIGVREEDAKKNNSVEYADGLSYDLEAGWYEFKCPLPDLMAQMTKLLIHTGNNKAPQPLECRDMIRYYLTHEQGGNLKEDVVVSDDFDVLVDAIAFYYARFTAGDLIEDVLQELKDSSSWTMSCRDLVKAVSPVSSTTTRLLFNVLHYRPNLLPDASKLLTLPLSSSSSATGVADIVTAEVQSVVAIDLHTHLLPPSHGPLCLWGIDELLTYVSYCSFFS